MIGATKKQRKEAKKQGRKQWDRPHQEAGLTLETAFPTKLTKLTVSQNGPEVGSSSSDFDIFAPKTRGFVSNQSTCRSIFSFFFTAEIQR